eukprot:3557683-Prymnesium_polylepis.2
MCIRDRHKPCRRHDMCRGKVVCGCSGWQVNAASRSMIGPRRRRSRVRPVKRGVNPPSCTAPRNGRPTTTRRDRHGIHRSTPCTTHGWVGWHLKCRHDRSSARAQS